MADFGVAVVGAGFIGPVHVEGLRRAGQHVVGILGVDDQESQRAAQTMGLSRAFRTLDEVLADPQVHAVAQGAMWESGEALMRRYPQEFDCANQGEHIADLLHRFQNRALGDTVYRVGRDLLRKLSPEDRLIAAMRMHVAEGVDPKHTIQGTGAALLFRKTDDQGRMFERDEEFVREWYARGVEQVLTEWSKLRANDTGDSRLIAEIVAAHDNWAKRN